MKKLLMSVCAACCAVCLAKEPVKLILDTDMIEDQTTVLAAVRGTNDYFNVERGTYVMVGPDGSNLWKPDPTSENYRLTEKMPKAQVGKIIDELIARPKKR